MWPSSPALTRPLLLDADVHSPDDSMRMDYNCPTPHLTTLKATLPIPIHRCTSALTRLLSAQEAPPDAPSDNTDREQPATPTHPHAAVQPLWGLPAAVWRSASRRALLTTTSIESGAQLTTSPSVPSLASDEAAAPDHNAPSAHAEPAWWQRLHNTATPSRVDATTITCHVAPRAALQTEAHGQCPAPAVQLLAELRDAMACWLVVCVGAQIALMWYLASGLLSRNAAGVLLMLLLSSGNALGFLGGVAFMWCSPSATTTSMALLVATGAWLLAALSCVGALLSLCVGLGLVLVIDSNTHLTETYVGGWTVAAYLVLPPPLVAACSLACAVKLGRLLHVLWGGTPVQTPV